MIDTDLIHKRIQRFVDHSGKSISQLERESDIGYGTLSGFLRSKGTAPSANTIYQICYTYGISANWLLGLDELDGEEI